MAATFSAAWTALALVSLGPIANMIPKAALAGILIVVAYSMIDKYRLKLSWRSGKRHDWCCVARWARRWSCRWSSRSSSACSCRWSSCLRTTGKTDLTQLVPRSDSGFDELPFNRAAPSPVVTVNLEGDLYFAAAEDLDHELLKCVTPETRVVVLRMKRLRAVGSTAMAMLEHFWTILRDRKIYLVVCGIEDELQQIMTGSGLRERIGEQNIFYADNKLFQSTELALARAWSIVEMEKALGARFGRRSSQVAQGSHRASDIMTARCIRFGNEHQLREAVWLMSELHKHTKSISPLTAVLAGSRSEARRRAVAVAAAASARGGR